MIAYQQIHGNVILLKVPCMACRKFHIHGNGNVDRPLTAPGQTTSRVSHCPSDGYDADAILVSPMPFKKSWQTPQGRISKRYLADAA